MKLYTSPAGIACADCGYAVKFDYEPTCWKTGVIFGKCINGKCANHNRIFKFPLTSVEVDFVEQE